MKKIKLLNFVIAFVVFFNSSCNNRVAESESLIKGFSLDFNWGPSGSWSFASPGDWANVSPEEQIKWYKDLGVNTIQTFCIAANGYAWYKGGIVPEQPGLKYNYLTDMVRLGHKENMKVMGYFCIGSNPRWGKENPEYSYGCSPLLTKGMSTNCHIPYTQKYLSYLDSAIRNAIKVTAVDGFLVDWIWQPNRESTNGKWIESEKRRFEELMGKTFPGEDKLTELENTEYSRVAIDKCWEVIYKATKETNPNCIIWLSCNNPCHPHVVNSKMFKQIDWLMNEAGDLESLNAIKAMIGVQTKLITCFAEWNKVDAKAIVPDAIKNGVGLYGFVRPNDNGVLSTIDSYLSLPIDSFKGDHRNIATLSRVFNGLPLDFIKK